MSWILWILIIIVLLVVAYTFRKTVLGSNDAYFSSASDYLNNINPQRLTSIDRNSSEYRGYVQSIKNYLKDVVINKTKYMANIDGITQRNNENADKVLKRIIILEQYFPIREIDKEYIAETNNEISDIIEKSKYGIKDFGYILALLKHVNFWGGDNAKKGGGVCNDPPIYNPVKSYILHLLINCDFRDIYNETGKLYDLAQIIINKHIPKEAALDAELTANYPTLDNYWKDLAFICYYIKKTHNPKTTKEWLERFYNLADKKVTFKNIAKPGDQPRYSDPPNIELPELDATDVGNVNTELLRLKGNIVKQDADDDAFLTPLIENNIKIGKINKDVPLVDDVNTTQHMNAINNIDADMVVDLMMLSNFISDIPKSEPTHQKYRLIMSALKDKASILNAYRNSATAPITGFVRNDLDKFVTYVNDVRAFNGAVSANCDKKKKLTAFIDIIKPLIGDAVGSRKSRAMTFQQYLLGVPTNVDTIPAGTAGKSALSMERSKKTKDYLDTYETDYDNIFNRLNPPFTCNLSADKLKMSAIYEGMLSKKVNDYIAENQTIDLGNLAADIEAAIDTDLKRKETAEKAKRASAYKKESDDKKIQRIATLAIDETNDLYKTYMTLIEEKEKLLKKSDFPDIEAANIYIDQISIGKIIPYVKSMVEVGLNRILDVVTPENVKDMVKVAMSTEFTNNDGDKININSTFSNVNKKIPRSFDPNSLKLASKDLENLIKDLDGPFIERLVADIARKALKGTPDDSNSAYIALVEALRILRAKTDFSKEVKDLMVKPDLPGWVLARPIPLSTPFGVEQDVMAGIGGSSPGGPPPPPGMGPPPPPPPGMGPPPPPPGMGPVRKKPPMPSIAEEMYDKAKGSDPSKYIVLEAIGERTGFEYPVEKRPDEENIETPEGETEVSLSDVKDSLQKIARNDPETAINLLAKSLLSQKDLVKYQSKEERLKQIKSMLSRA